MIVSEPRQDTRNANSFTTGGILKGECGAIIINQATYDVYGHVVGSGPLGHAYLVPTSHGSEAGQEDLPQNHRLFSPLPDPTVAVVVCREDEGPASSFARKPRA